jgi:hypothetical protein
MAEGKQVVLHVYSLTVGDNSSATTTTASFWTRWLPSIGMGAHHTSIELDGYHYTFAATVGIAKSRAAAAGVPAHAEFKERIVLGTCDIGQRVNGILSQLRQTFRGNSYHLVHRNCNHFAETFATAILLYNELLAGDDDYKDEKDRLSRSTSRLETFPLWVNRLATASKMIVGHDADIVPCNVLEEARTAARGR